MTLNNIAEDIAILAFNHRLDLDKIFIKLREKTYKEFQDLEEKDKKKENNNDDNDELITYDFMYIVRPDIERDYKIIGLEIMNCLKNISDKYSDDLDINDKDIDHWGKKNLAYMIKGYTEGYYTLIRDITCSRRVMNNLIDKILKGDKDILRYMIVRKGE